MIVFFERKDSYPDLDIDELDNRFHLSITGENDICFDTGTSDGE